MVAVYYISSYRHCVFSIKQRQPLIHPSLRDRLWPFLGRIASQNGMKAIEIGGMPDHVHLLLSLPSTLSDERYLWECARASATPSGIIWPSSVAHAAALPI